MKKIKLAILLSILFLLSSCIDKSYFTKRNNYYSSGLYWGENESTTTIIYLSVKRIYEEEYVAAKGLNVVKDEVRPAYYLIRLYEKENENVNIYNYFDLKGTEDGFHSLHIRYYDYNYSQLTPRMTYSYSSKTNITSYFNVYIAHSSIGYIIDTNLYLNGEKL